MMNWKKGFALLFMGMMITSGLVAICAPAVSADQEIRQDWLELVFDDTTQIDGLPTPYTDRVFDRQNQWNEYRPGEGDGAKDWTTVGATENLLRIDIRVLDADCDDLYINITSVEEDSWWDFDDTGDTTTPNAFPVGSTIAGANFGAGSVNTAEFDFDILVTDYVGYGDETEVTCSYSYWDNNAAERRTGNFNVYIYLSTLYDDSDHDEDHVTSFPDLTESEANDDGAYFEAGDVFADTQLTLPNHLGEAVSDIWVNITPPAGSGITVDAGGTAWFPGSLSGSGSTQAFNYRTNVDIGTPPGRYTGTASLEYTTNAGLRVTEPSANIDWLVDFSFRDDDCAPPDKMYSFDQMQVTSAALVDDGSGLRMFEDHQPTDTVDITQSTFGDRRITINVTITNNGNTPLYNVEFRVDPNSPGAWQNFRNPLFYWEHVGAAAHYDTISETYAFIDIGDSVNFTIELTVIKEIPIGEHRLPIIYDGFYFNDGSLGEATGFIEINSAGAPVPGELVVVFSITVTDNAIDCHVTVTVPVGPNDKTDIRANMIVCTLTNDEGYNFIDVRVRANFTGCPWYQPVINQGGPWVWADEANPATPTASWLALDTMTATFTVDTDYMDIPDRYPFQLEITAIIEETLVEVTATIGQLEGAVIDFTGYGPIVFIEAFTADSIVPGERFDLDLTIVNEGDDTLRDIWVIIPPDNTEPYSWALEQEFKYQFDWGWIFEEWFEFDDVGQTMDIDFDNFEFPSEMFYTMETLDVDNVREIIEINLYMDGVYSMPGSTINLIHIMELAPGANTSVTFEMIADKDMVNGKPYNVVVTITGIGADGESYNFSQTLEVLSSLPGDSYNPVELDWFDAGMKLLTLVLFFIIVLAILLWVYNKYKGEPEEDEEEEEEFDFEDEEPSFATEETKVEAKEPELIAP